MQIKPFENRYRDDLIFMVLEAKDALGRKPRINEDLLDINETTSKRAIVSGLRWTKEIA